MPPSRRIGTIGHSITPSICALPGVQETVQGQFARAAANLLQPVVPPARLRAAKLAGDIDTARVRDVIRQEVREILLAAGIFLPPPAPKPKRRGPPLRLIDK
jgi:hypothetical protein